MSDLIEVLQLYRYFGGCSLRCTEWLDSWAFISFKLLALWRSARVGISSS
ncbi:hypothetical protein KCP76_23705 [Salmonella enterica subsp. enterica serovar Weltevreden]|nr:hypothetical protein KCP76_23705 [Salmonella enterica subsp. enterica serovar Weltevreden]